MTIGHNQGPDFDEEGDGPVRVRVIRIHINDWVASTRGLSLEEEGFFWRIHLLMYDRMGILVDDDAYNARALSCDVRTYRRLKGQLIGLGKLHLEDGRISHPRIVREIEQFVAEHRRRAAAARAREERKKEIAPTSAGLRPDFAPTSAELPGDLRAISGELRPELITLKSENINKNNGCTATTVTTRATEPSRVRAFPKPKPKPLEESPLPPSGGDALETAFEDFWEAFPKGRKRGKGSTRDIFRKIVTGRHRRGLRAKAVELVEAARRYAATKPDPDYAPMPATWLNGGRWEDDVSSTPPVVWWRNPEKLRGMNRDRWLAGVRKFANGVWPVDKLGPPPGHPECVVPSAIVDELRLTDRYTPAGIAKNPH